MKSLAELKRVLNLHQEALEHMLKEANERLSSDFGIENDLRRKKMVFRASEALAKSAAIIQGGGGGGSEPS